MSHGTLAAIAVTVSVATGGAVLGTVVLVSSSIDAAGSPPASAVVTGPAAKAPEGSPGPSIVFPTGSAAASAPVSAPAASASASATPSVRHGTAAPSAVAKSFDTTTARAGFGGPYRFVAHLSGLPGLMNLGGLVQGVVTDATHFVLDFPESNFITHYERDGSTAQALVHGQTVVVQPGVGTAGAISPEAMLPPGLWGQAIAPWEATLQPDGTGGGFAADSGVLTGKAKDLGILAHEWQLDAKTDASGRLMSVALSGRTWDKDFALDMVILYG